jgi:hypothetical protein
MVLDVADLSCANLSQLGRDEVLRPFFGKNLGTALDAVQIEKTCFPQAFMKRSVQLLKRAARKQQIRIYDIVTEENFDDFQLKMNKIAFDGLSYQMVLSAVPTSRSEASTTEQYFRRIQDSVERK